jgi:hypothetical protein
MPSISNYRDGNGIYLSYKLGLQLKKQAVSSKRKGFYLYKEKLDPREISAKKISQGRQDQQDGQDIAASGRKAHRRRRKNLYPVKSFL